MPLPCYVYMEDTGLVGKDDGHAAWRKTEVHLTVAGRVLCGNMLTDGYSGKRTLRVTLDDIRLDRPLAKTLLLEVYDISRDTMRDYSCCIAEAFFDLESLIQRAFYRAQASDLIRRITAA